MKDDYRQIIKEIEDKGFTEADIASKVGATTKAVQFWKSGKHNPVGEKLRKLLELRGGPIKSNRHTFITSESPELTLLRIQNIVMNIEAKQDAQNELLQQILIEISKMPEEEIRAAFSKILTASLSGGIQDNNILHRNK